ncbi:tRNA-specific 2-thiouridylase MnmA [Labeo rohita]|uniref:tRNA-specific 2-thiouridylase MnmA n=1 Tax=Labeo rohita TaxID=84645 RepID=A0ABQ8L2V9_LABRO|nr:tRNA-specific 2-thiouridylase MnmA [Labeo rohita]
MADLPPSKPSLFKPPFWSTGMDCFGPFVIKSGRKTEKRWGLLFKCQTTRCVHLELLTSLDADSFLLALRCFVARRGRPYKVICDQGTNFHGGESELKYAFDQLNPDLKDKLWNHQIKFTYNPPYAPHFGGTWEREIRSIKSALRSILGSQVVTEEVLTTLSVEVEEILNSKPLWYVSSNADDLDPVTPNLLLMGRQDASLPQVIYADSNVLTRRRYIARHSQFLADQFWTRFIRNYLPTLQVRQKWQQDQGNLENSDIILFLDTRLPRALWPIGKVLKTLQVRQKWQQDQGNLENSDIGIFLDTRLPRALWPIGKVLKTFSGKDGCVRVAEIEIKGKSYVRPVSHLIPLPFIKD